MKSYIYILVAILSSILDFGLVVHDDGTWAGNTHWPGDQGGVLFFYRRPPVSTGCPELDQVLSDAYSGGESRYLKIGDACGRLVVVYRDDFFLRDENIEKVKFVADHEAFHLFAQFFGNGIPLELMDSSGGPIVKGGDFFSLVQRKAGWGEFGVDACEFVGDCLRYRGSGYFEYMERVVYIEWPAEYYAYLRLMKRGGDDFSYMSMRKELGDFDEYSSGVIIGRYLSSIDSGWMDKLKEGYL